VRSYAGNRQPVLSDASQPRDGCAFAIDLSAARLDVAEGRRCAPTSRCASYSASASHHARRAHRLDPFARDIVPSPRPSARTIDVRRRRCGQRGAAERAPAARSSAHGPVRIRVDGALPRREVRAGDCQRQFVGDLGDDAEAHVVRRPTGRACLDFANAARQGAGVPAMSCRSQRRAHAGSGAPRRVRSVRSNRRDSPTPPPSMSVRRPSMYVAYARAERRPMVVCGVQAAQPRRQHVDELGRLPIPGRLDAGSTIGSTFVAGRVRSSIMASIPVRSATDPARRADATDSGRPSCRDGHSGYLLPLPVMRASHPAGPSSSVPTYNNERPARTCQDRRVRESVTIEPRRQESAPELRRTARQASPCVQHYRVVACSDDPGRHAQRYARHRRAHPSAGRVRAAGARGPRSTKPNCSRTSSVSGPTLR